MPSGFILPYTIEAWMMCWIPAFPINYHPKIDQSHNKANRTLLRCSWWDSNQWSLTPKSSGLLLVSMNGQELLLTDVIVLVVECPNKLPPGGHFPLAVDSGLQICREVPGPRHWVRVGARVILWRAVREKCVNTHLMLWQLSQSHRFVGTVCPYMDIVYNPTYSAPYAVLLSNVFLVLTLSTHSISSSHFWLPEWLNVPYFHFP